MQKTAEVKRDWLQMDAKGQIVGRLATQIAHRLMGKHKPTYTPHIDGGDYVVVINASEIELSREKATKKVYRHHTGYLGGLKEVSFATQKEEHPDRIIRDAVKTMLPDNKLRGPRLARLKIFAGAEHPHKTHFSK